MKLLTSIIAAFIMARASDASREIQMRGEDSKNLRNLGLPLLKPSTLEAEKDEIVAMHNDARKTVNPPANPPLQPLQWDDNLARTAQAWADGCDYDRGHGQVGVTKTIIAPDGKPFGNRWIGQNMGAANYKTYTGQTATRSWDAEKSDYDLCTNSNTGVVGHYTQVVWDTTTHVGCGRSKCPQSEWSVIIVCNYWPGGNWSGRDGEVTRPYDSSSCGEQDRS